MAYFLIIIGLIMLFAGGEFLVTGAASLAQRLRVSPTIVGVVIVGFGTSAPELLVSLQAALNDMPALSMGNVIGSNISNILFILGVASIINPIKIMGLAAIRRDMLMMLLSAVMLLIVAFLGEITRLMALLFIAMISFYLSLVYRVEKKLAGEAPPIDDIFFQSISIWKQSAKIIGGIVFLGLGAHTLIEGSVTIARLFHLSEGVIGLTIVAIGTSLPELAAGIISSTKKESGILLGNIIGSNIFNVLSILGFTALVTPFTIDSSFLNFDLPVMTVTMLVLSLFIFRKWTISRLIGIIFCISYSLYIFHIV